MITEAQNTKNALALNGAHAGRRVFVLGAGPQLGELDDAARRYLAEQVTIGVNRTQYAIEPTYFLSAYVAEVLLALLRCEHTQPIHMSARYGPPLFDETISVQRVMYTSGPIPPRFQPTRPALFTLNNVALAATHLAAVLGAGEVVYIGVEQRNRIHFYDTDEALKQQMRADLASLSEYEHLFRLEHDYATLDNAMQALDQDAEHLRTQPFYDWDHAPTFATFFARLGAEGRRRFRTTSADSVVADAGAMFVPLEDLMSEDGFSG